MRLIAFLNKLYIFFELVEIFPQENGRDACLNLYYARNRCTVRLDGNEAAEGDMPKIKAKDLYDMLEQAQILIVVCHNIQYILTVLQWERFSQK